MRCLDHIDMAAVTGAAAVLASAAFFFAYLGVQHEPAIPPMDTAEESLALELSQAIDEAVVRSTDAQERHAQAQVQLGKAIADLLGRENHQAAVLSSIARVAAGADRARAEYLQHAFKHPLDWGGATFLALEGAAAAGTQVELGRLLVSTTQQWHTEMETAQERYGEALVTALLAQERAEQAPQASQATIAGAAAAMSALVDRTMPGPTAEIGREASWGFGSIGDGVLLSALVLGGGVALLVAAGVGLSEARLRTVTLATHCDEHKKDVMVEMLASDDTAYEVARCSAFNGGPVTCDKHCLEGVARIAV